MSRERSCGQPGTIDYRDPPGVCRGNPRTWFQKFYQDRGGIGHALALDMARRGAAAIVS
jgi:hypothetical protein